ncbi:MAG TPA: hypothetical protein ENN30_01970, partial [Candidatus Woesearchaeota archaeon]|nr:hypothetical protein [Candidatus Woesearchaeota archaeon]
MEFNKNLKIGLAVLSIVLVLSAYAFIKNDGISDVEVAEAPKTTGSSLTGMVQVVETKPQGLAASVEVI